MKTKEIESKWQKYWEEHNTFVASNESEKEKYYYLVEFPYPSGAGLHVGHVRSYTALDIMARKKRMTGYNVLFPMGWDAFGAPAEQYAIKNHIHPKEAVQENIKTFKNQIQSLGISFDWSREFSTTDPEYYKWTQWQFLKFFEHGMAYKAKKNINWCPKCKTGLSNEDSSGGVCERCGSEVVQKEKEQWMLKMSDYAEDLIEGLKDTDFQEKIKTAQINWIGKSTGAEVEFPLNGIDEKLTVYTTRPDTLYGVTFMVIAPEHPIINTYSGLISNMNEIIDYREQTNKKTEFERTQVNKDKTGVKLEGLTAINPITKREVPIYISDYVMMNYGTGAIMAVPAHDQRDYDFAKKFDLEIIPVIEKITGTPNEEENYKEMVIALLYNKETGKYLFLEDKLEENETIEDAAKRIVTEAGYNHAVYVRTSFPVNHHYYDEEKDKYYECGATGVYFEVEKEEKHENWIEKNKIEKEVTNELYQTIYEYLVKEVAFTEDGKMINSDFLDGLTNKKESIEKMIDYLEQEHLGTRKTNYKLQDWIFTRQRFWGEPIPLIHCEECGWVPVPEKDLPVLLPDVAEYEPTDNGESPLANIKEWVNCKCPKCGRDARRETDTMPNWAGSSWYWLRYMDPKNDKELASMDSLKYWGQVDWYNGGMEHATRHLLYARFWNQFLYNIGLVPYKEPFRVRAAHGMILGDGGVKMSKSLGNVINPDDMVNLYGADALRTYEMFIGDYEKEATWSEQGLKGCKKFLDRVEKIGQKLNEEEGYTKKLESLIHKTIKKVTEDIDNLKFNTAVSALMILLNNYEEQETITKSDYRTLLHLLNPFAPHLTEELNEEYNLGKVLCESVWPKYDSEKLVEDAKTIAVQVNGKVRGAIEVNINDDDEAVKEKALSEENVKKHTEGKTLVKVIVIKGKIVNIVVK